MNKFNFISYKIKVSLAVILLLGLSWCSLVSAAGTPTIFSYQGRLTNSAGNLLGGSGTTYYFKFSIWNVATGGTQSPNQVWPTGAPQSFSTTVRQGVFNVNIGDTASGYPDALNYNFSANKDIFLQTEVSTNGVTFEAITPRQRISSAVFAQVAGAVSGLGQSSFGTLSPGSNAVVTIESTTTTSIPALVRGAVGQVASLLRFEDSSSNHLFSINSTGGIFASSTLVVGTSTANSFVVNAGGNVGIGTFSPARKLNILDVNSVPQLRLSQSSGIFGEFYIDSAGDVQFSSTGGNYRMQNENLWVCSGGSCGVDTPADKGNIVVENAVILNNKFKLKQVDASTTVMYDSVDSEILEFDEGQ